MPIQTSCPSCERPLRVPDDLIGKAVKCPGCGATWTVAAEAPEPPHEEPPAPPPPPPEGPPVDTYRESLPAADSMAPTSEGIREQQSETRPTPPSAPTPPSLDELEDEDEDPEYFDRLDDRRRGRIYENYREQAKSKVMGPAIGLMVTAGINFLSALLNIGYGVFQVVMMSSMPARPGAAPPPTGVMAIAGGMYGLFALFYLIMGGVMLYGALEMKKLRRYTLSMAACILAIIPCQGCCYITGIPFGVWGLVVLLDPKVKSVFAGSTSTAGPAE